MGNLRVMFSSVLSSGLSLMKLLQLEVAAHCGKGKERARHSLLFCTGSIKYLPGTYAYISLAKVSHMVTCNFTPAQKCILLGAKYVVDSTNDDRRRKETSR